MLKQRIYTAIVLLILMVSMLFWAPNNIWAIFTGLIALLALWEYGRISGLTPKQNHIYLLITALLGLIAYLNDWHFPNAIWLLIIVFWLIIMPVWLYRKWLIHNTYVAYIIGWILMMPFWFALITLRPNTNSATSLIVIMGLVWVADISAFFTGKAFGKHKLAPAISPGKSWEGVIGAIIFVSIYMLLLYQSNWLLINTTWSVNLLIGLLLTAVSICGDLLESWLKRCASIKDSSQLLPGHGGVFDRTDSLIAVLSLYAAFMVIMG